MKRKTESAAEESLFLKYFLQNSVEKLKTDIEEHGASETLTLVLNLMEKPSSLKEDVFLPHLYFVLNSLPDHSNPVLSNIKNQLEYMLDLNAAQKSSHFTEDPFSLLKPTHVVPEKELKKELGRVCSDESSKDFPKEIVEKNEKEEDIIPNVSHFIWVGSCLNTPEYRKGMEELRKKNEQEVIVLWSDHVLKNNLKDTKPTEFFLEMSEWAKKNKVFLIDIAYVEDILTEFNLATPFKELMLNKNYGGASDVLRCCILYKFGGKYFDIDIGFSKSFESILAGTSEILFNADPEKTYDMQKWSTIMNDVIYAKSKSLVMRNLLAALSTRLGFPYKSICPLVKSNFYAQAIPYEKAFHSISSADVFKEMVIHQTGPGALDGFIKDNYKKDKVPTLSVAPLELKCANSWIRMPGIATKEFNTEDVKVVLTLLLSELRKEGKILRLQRVFEKFSVNPDTLHLALLTLATQYPEIASKIMYVDSTKFLSKSSLFLLENKSLFNSMDKKKFVERAITELTNNTHTSMEAIAYFSENYPGQFNRESVFKRFKISSLFNYEKLLPFYVNQGLTLSPDHFSEISAESFENFRILFNFCEHREEKILPVLSDEQYNELIIKIIRIPFKSKFEYEDRIALLSRITQSLSTKIISRDRFNEFFLIYSKSKKEELETNILFERESQFPVIKNATIQCLKTISRSGSLDIFPTPSSLIEIIEAHYLKKPEIVHFLVFYFKMFNEQTKLLDTKVQEDQFDLLKEKFLYELDDDAIKEIQTQFKEHLQVTIDFQILKNILSTMNPFCLVRLVDWLPRDGIDRLLNSDPSILSKKLNLVYDLYYTYKLRLKIDLCALSQLTIEQSDLLIALCEQSVKNDSLNSKLFSFMLENATFLEDLKPVLGYFLELDKKSPRGTFFDDALTPLLLKIKSALLSKTEILFNEQDQRILTKNKPLQTVLQTLQEKGLLKIPDGHSRSSDDVSLSPSDL